MYILSHYVSLNFLFLLREWINLFILISHDSHTLFQTASHLLYQILGISICLFCVNTFRINNLLSCSLNQIFSIILGLFRLNTLILIFILSCYFSNKIRGIILSLFSIIVSITFLLWIVYLNIFHIQTWNKFLRFINTFLKFMMDHNIQLFLTLLIHITHLFFLIQVTHLFFLIQVTSRLQLIVYCCFFI